MVVARPSRQWSWIMPHCRYRSSGIRGGGCSPVRETPARASPDREQLWSPFGNSGVVRIPQVGWIRYIFLRRTQEGSRSRPPEIWTFSIWNRGSLVPSKSRILGKVESVARKERFKNTNYYIDSRREALLDCLTTNKPRRVWQGVAYNILENFFPAYFLHCLTREATILGARMEWQS